MNPSDDVRVVSRYGGGEREVGIDGIGGVWSRAQTGLGPTTWRMVEGGDDPISDAEVEIARLALKLEDHTE